MGPTKISVNVEIVRHASRYSIYLTRGHRFLQLPGNASVGHQRGRQYCSRRVWHGAVSATFIVDTLRGTIDDHSSLVTDAFYQSTQPSLWDRPLWTDNPYTRIKIRSGYLYYRSRSRDDNTFGSVRVSVRLSVGALLFETFHL